ncbi:sensor histidine kinase [Paucibacter soli]|uniref:sensor histidine kinase n=1 Tax=Paucibacter soli TaxID=3133433 RepID=UPI0030A30F63
MDRSFVVLAVDDRESNLLAIRALLAGLPEFELCEARSGEEALLITMQRPIHLILLDVNMPGMDGFETARHLQSVERTRQIPIVFLTAYSKAEDFVQRGYDLGAVDYLYKPLESNLLLNRMRMYRRLYEGHQDLRDSRDSLMHAMGELRDTQQRLLRSQKLAALMPMVAAVAHELNTPIGNCQLMASTLREETLEMLAHWRAGEGMRRRDLDSFLSSNAAAIEILSDGLNRAAQVVARFKEIAIDEHAWTRTRFDLGEAVTVAVAEARTRVLRPDVHIELALVEGVRMDSYPSPIAQLLDELIANSQLHGFGAEGSGRIAISIQRDGAHCLLRYSDDGRGMTPEVLARVFDPFYTTRFGQGSSGLGLAICYNLVVGLLGGELNASSEPGRGASFSVRLPLEAPRAAQRAEASSLNTATTDTSS